MLGVQRESVDPPVCGIIWNVAERPFLHARAHMHTHIHTLPNTQWDSVFSPDVCKGTFLPRFNTKQLSFQASYHFIFSSLFPFLFTRVFSVQILFFNVWLQGGRNVLRLFHLHLVCAGLQMCCLKSDDPMHFLCMEDWISSVDLQWIRILWLEINEPLIRVRWKWELDRLKWWQDLCGTDWTEVISTFDVHTVYQSYQPFPLLFHSHEKWNYLWCLNNAWEQESGSICVHVFHRCKENEEK